MKEIRHEVALRINNGVARYRVERVFSNEGKLHDEAVVDISLPVGAAATGLRIKVGNDWFEGELMRRERAAELYRELTGFGPHLPKDPALLSWRWSSELELRVFPVPPGGKSTVGYSLTAPTTYRDGRYFVAYPRIPGENGLSTSSLRVAGLEPRIDGRPVVAGRALPLVVDQSIPAWFGERQPSPGASYIKSDIEVADDEKTQSVEVKVDIQHTYRGDLVLELITPDGKWHTLADVAGGGENDVRQTFPMTFDQPLPTQGSWRLVVSDHAGLDTGTLKKWSIDATVGERHIQASAADTPKFIPDATSAGDDGQATISIATPPIDTVATRLGSVPAAVDKEFFRLEIDTAPELRPLPKKLSTVFVMDASRSLPSDEMDGQIELARAFLKHVPDATFEVVLVRRHATRLLGRFAPAGEFDALIEAASQDDKLELGNGSALDAGIKLAAKTLQRRRGPRTMVLLTDGLLRPKWRNRFAFDELNQAPHGTATHVVLPTEGGSVVTDRRNDGHPLSPIAKRGGGVLLHVEDIGSGSKELDAIALGLVRPIRIDNFRIEGVTFPDDRELPNRLEEGDGLREMAQLQKAPKRVVLHGHIWAKPFRREVEATLAFSRATAAFVFSHDMHQDLSEEEQFRLAMTGRAVSPVTSYLAIEPGVRPSVIGLESISTTGFGSGSGIGSAYGAGGLGLAGHPPFDLKAVMADDVEACTKKHAPKPGWSVKLDLQLTYEEIVDIDAPKGDLARCIAEAAWKVALPDYEYSKKRDTLTVSFP
ncbi:MAG: proprotein convertase P-domain-containing protein [Deltaproteobacteria bacterium]|nr:proprotein convertase P-domain-containing protein [Deltaproteobacteria bacterium]